MHSQTIQFIHETVARQWKVIRKAPAFTATQRVFKQV